MVQSMMYNRVNVNAHVVIIIIVPLMVKRTTGKVETDSEMGVCCAHEGFNTFCIRHRPDGITFPISNEGNGPFIIGMSCTHYNHAERKAFSALCG